MRGTADPLSGSPAVTAAPKLSMFLMVGDAVVMRCSSRSVGMRASGLLGCPTGRRGGTRAHSIGLEKAAAASRSARTSPAMAKKPSAHGAPTATLGWHLCATAQHAWL